MQVSLLHALMVAALKGPLLPRIAAMHACVVAPRWRWPQDKANLERQLKQLNSRSSLLEKNLEKKDAQVRMLACKKHSTSVQRCSCRQCAFEG